MATPTISKTQEQLIETLELLQERVIEVNKQAVEANKRVVASISERVPAELSERLATLPRPTLPLIDLDAADFPTPSEAVDGVFDFVEQITKTNRRFASELVSLWSSVEEAAEAPAPATATKKAPAKKAAAKRAPAKKAAAKTSK